MPPPDAADHREPWGVVFALGITQITAWGTVYYLFALLLDPLQAELTASKSAIVGAFALSLLVSGLLAPAVGRHVDRHGGRGVMSLGSLLAAVGLGGLSEVHTLTAWYAAWLLLGVAMACTLYEPAFTVLTRAFQQRQRRAIAVLTLFGGFASTVFWPLGQAMIETVGWRETALLFAALNLTICLPLHWAALPPAVPHGSFRHPSGLRAAALGEALRDRRFWWLGAAFAANMLVMTAMSVHLIAMLVAKGFSATEAAALGALVGPMQVLGRLAEVTIGARIAPSTVGLLALATLPASLHLFAASGTSLVAFVVFAVLYGTGNGVMTIVRGAVPAELYGPRHYGAINGALAAPVLAARAAGPLVAALVYALLEQQYPATVQVLAALAAIALVFFVVALRLHPRDAPDRET